MLEHMFIATCLPLGIYLGRVVRTMWERTRGRQ